MEVGVMKIFVVEVRVLASGVMLDDATLGGLRVCRARKQSNC